MSTLMLRLGNADELMYRILVHMATCTRVIESVIDSTNTRNLCPA